MWWLGALAIGGMAIVVAVWRRRITRERPVQHEVAAAPVAAPDLPGSDSTPAPRMLAPRAASPRTPVQLPQRSQLAVSFHPTRAGLNLISATVEGEIELVNTGDVRADDIRLEVRLLGASREQDRDLAAARSEPVRRPATAPFTLAPGERRRVRAVAAMPRHAIEPLTAAGRPMVVPLVAINILYDRGERQVAAAWVVGIERTDSAKLAPLWLDVEPRSFDTVAAREHGAVFTR